MAAAANDIQALVQNQRTLLEQGLHSSSQILVRKMHRHMFAPILLRFYLRYIPIPWKGHLMVSISAADLAKSGSTTAANVQFESLVMLADLQTSCLSTSRDWGLKTPGTTSTPQREP